MPEQLLTWLMKYRTRVLIDVILIVTVLYKFVSDENLSELTNIKVGFNGLQVVDPMFDGFVNNFVLRYLNKHEPYERFLGPYHCQHHLKPRSIRQDPHL